MNRTQSTRLRDSSCRPWGRVGRKEQGPRNLVHASHVVSPSPPSLALAAVLLACLSACGSAPKSRPDMPIIRVQVVNDQGEPLKGIRATATRSEVSEDGRVVRFLGEPRRVGPSDKDGFINLVGRDPREGDGPMEWEIDDRTKESYGYRVSLWGKDVLPTNLSARFSSFPRRLEVKTPRRGVYPPGRRDGEGEAEDRRCREVIGCPDEEAQVGIQAEEGGGRALEGPPEVRHRVRDRVDRGGEDVRLPVTALQGDEGPGSLLLAGPPRVG
jgi:hypothetical protein